MKSPIPHSIVHSFSIWRSDISFGGWNIAMSGNLFHSCFFYQRRLRILLFLFIINIFFVVIAVIGSRMTMHGPHGCWFEWMQRGFMMTPVQTNNQQFHSHEWWARENDWMRNDDRGNEEWKEKTNMKVTSFLSQGQPKY